MARASRANFAELPAKPQGFRPPAGSSVVPGAESVPSNKPPFVHGASLPPLSQQPSSESHTTELLAAASVHTAGDHTVRASDSDSAPEGGPPQAVRIAIKSKGRILILDPADILAVEAEGNYVSLTHRSESHLLRESISAMAEKLKHYGFVRIHRSVLVNASWVEEICPGATGDYLLRLVGGKQYVVSRTYRQNLKLLAQSWIGLDSFVED